MIRKLSIPLMACLAILAAPIAGSANDAPVKIKWGDGSESCGWELVENGAGNQVISCTQGDCNGWCSRTGPPANPCVCNAGYLP